MNDRVYQSPVRLTWDPDGTPIVLVEFLDDLEALVLPTGQKLVQQANLVRSPGSKNFDRGNHSNSLRYVKQVECDSLQAAIALQLAGMASIPSGTKDIRIEVQGEAARQRIKNCVITGWDGQPEGRFASIGRTIQGGQIITEP